MKDSVTARAGLASALLIFALFAGCGGNKGDIKTCDKRQRYQDSAVNERVRTPEDLDELNRQRELPVPEANPSEERPPGSPCLELPPRIIGTG